MTTKLRALALVLAIAGGGVAPAAAQQTGAPNPDPRVGLGAGIFDAAEATWNMRLLSKTPPAREFIGQMNSDLAFTGKYAIQGNFNGFQVWDISDPTRPTLVRGFVCPASQSDVSVYKNLLFVSGEDYGGRLDCGTQGVREQVSTERLRGIRIFDITDIQNPKYVGNVQTCRGSHTHTVLVDPKDQENVYVYISGSAAVRSPNELPGCVQTTPDRDPNSPLSLRLFASRGVPANPAAGALADAGREIALPERPAPRVAVRSTLELPPRDASPANDPQLPVPSRAPSVAEAMREWPEIVEGAPSTRFDRSHFKEFGDSALVFETVYFVLSSDYNLYMDIQQAINLAIYQRFDERQIKFAFPTRTLWINQKETA